MSESAPAMAATQTDSNENKRDYLSHLLANVVNESGKSGSINLHRAKIGPNLEQHRPKQSCESV